MKLAPPSIEERVEVAKKHLKSSLEWKGPILGIVETRRHYTNYFRGIPHFKEYRMKLVTSDKSEDVFAALNLIEEKFAGYEFV